MQCGYKQKGNKTWHISINDPQLLVTGSFENSFLINLMCMILIQNSENKSPYKRHLGFNWNCLYLQCSHFHLYKTLIKKEHFLTCRYLLKEYSLPMNIPDCQMSL